MITGGQPQSLSCQYEILPPNYPLEDVPYPRAVPSSWELGSLQQLQRPGLPSEHLELKEEMIHELPLPPMPLKLVEPEAKALLLKLITAGEVSASGLLGALLRTSGLLSEREWSLSILYVEDEEVEGWAYVVFEYAVKGSYEELRELWDRLIDAFHASLGDRAMRHISVWVTSEDHEEGLQP